jgi:hypothetical protein
LIVVWMSTTAGVRVFAIELTELDGMRGAADPLVIGESVLGAVEDDAGEVDFELTATPMLAPATPAMRTAAITAVRLFFFDQPVVFGAASVIGSAAHWPAGSKGFSGSTRGGTAVSRLTKGGIESGIALGGSSFAGFVPSGDTEVTVVGSGSTGASFASSGAAGGIGRGIAFGGSVGVAGVSPSAAPCSPGNSSITAFLTDL